MRPIILVLTCTAAGMSETQKIPASFWRFVPSKVRLPKRYPSLPKKQPPALRAADVPRTHTAHTHSTHSAHTQRT